MKKRNGLWALALGVALLGAVSAKAADIDPQTYYKGKTITLVVDFKTGGGTDVQARYFAANWGKFIPGNPRITVTNLFPLPAGRNYVWKSKPDGTAVSFLASADVGSELIATTGEFQTDKFNYIGAHTSRDMILYVSGKVPYKTLKDSKGGSTQITVAESVSQPGDLSAIAFSTGVLALWMDAPLKIVPIAAAGTADSLLMIERGDTNGWIGGAQWYVLPRIRPGWLKNGTIKPIADMSNPDREPHPNAEASLDIPNAITWMTEEQKKLWRAIILSQVLTGKALATSPGVPPAVVKILRDSYVKALQDPEFAAGIEKIQQEPIALFKGEDLQKTIETSFVAFKAGLPDYKRLQKEVYDKFVKGL